MKFKQLLIALYNNQFHSICLLLIVLFKLISFIAQPQFHNNRPIRNVIQWDAVSYYAYLPALFIYHDSQLKAQPIDSTQTIYFNNWLQPTPNGNGVIKTSAGVAYLMLPFFGLAHAYAHLSSQYDTFGLSNPYQVMMAFSSLFFTLLGLYLLLKMLVLLKYKPPTIGFTLALIALGTNLHYYSIIPYSHSYAFFLISSLLYLTLLWLKKNKLKYAILLGLTVGLLSLVRPTDLVAVMAIPLIMVLGFNDLKTRFKYFYKNKWQIVVMLTCAFIVWIPQLIYWHSVTDSWLYFSYGNERFFFDQPQIAKFLWGYRKGWWVYTPLAFIACTSIFLPANRPYLIAYLSVFIPIVYLCSSWWSWWFGGSFGSRPMVNFYGFMALPLAGFIGYLLEKSKHFFILIVALGSFLVHLNMYQTWQYGAGLIHWDGMTKETYWLNFLKKHAGEGYWDKVVQPNYDDAMQGKNR